MTQAQCTCWCLCPLPVWCLRQGYLQHSQKNTAFLQPSPSCSHAKSCAEAQRRTFSLLCACSPKAILLKPLCLKKSLPKQAPPSACSPSLYTIPFPLLITLLTYSLLPSSCRPLPSHIHQLTQITASGLPEPPRHKEPWDM